MSTLRLGTRGSPLALYQANVAATLLHQRTGQHCEILVVRTSGDQLAEEPLARSGGKRLFVKELEDALLSGTIDLAVHSSKDMPAALPEGLAIGGVLPREDPRDALVLPRGSQRAVALDELSTTLGTRPRIGTSSVRRIAQLARLCPGARFQPVRGNVETRLQKLDSGAHDALTLASAGLMRLGYAERVSLAFPIDICLPAPGQGMIAIEIRRDDHRAGEAAAAVDHRESAVALEAERAVVERLGGGCQMPIAAFANIEGRSVHVEAMILSLDGTRVVRSAATGDIEASKLVGTRVADQLLALGGGEILADAKRALSAVEGHQR